MFKFFKKGFQLLPREYRNLLETQSKISEDDAFYVELLKNYLNETANSENLKKILIEFSQYDTEALAMELYNRGLILPNEISSAKYEGLTNGIIALINNTILTLYEENDIFTACELTLLIIYLLQKFAVTSRDFQLPFYYFRATVLYDMLGEKSKVVEFGEIAIELLKNVIKGLEIGIFTLNDFFGHVYSVEEIKEHISTLEKMIRENKN